MTGVLATLLLVLAVLLACVERMYFSLMRQNQAALVRDNEKLRGDARWLREYCADLERDVQDDIARHIQLCVRRAALAGPARI